MYFFYINCVLSRMLLVNTMLLFHIQGHCVINTTVCVKCGNNYRWKKNVFQTAKYEKIEHVPLGSF